MIVASRAMVEQRERRVHGIENVGRYIGIEAVSRFEIGYNVLEDYRHVIRILHPRQTLPTLDPEPDVEFVQGGVIDFGDVAMMTPIRSAE